MKKILILATITIFALLLSCKDQAKSEDNIGGKNSGLYKGYSFKEGIEVAKKESKPVLLYFYTTWCTYCRAMDKNVFSDSEVIDALKKDFVYIRIDTESNEALEYKTHRLSPREFAYMMGVQGFPTTVYMDKGLNPISKIPGFMQRNDFFKLLGYLVDECYKTNVDFDIYVKGKTNCKKI